MRGLGAALLSAIEKGDGEQLALLRQAHEIKIQQDEPGGPLSAMEAGAGVHRVAAEEPRQRAGALPLLPAFARPHPGQQCRSGQAPARSTGADRGELR